MNKQEILDTYGFLLVNNARCMGFLHGIADNFSNQSDTKSLEMAKFIFEFLIELNENPTIYYDKSYQAERLKTYCNKLKSVEFNLKKKNNNLMLKLSKLN